MQRKELREDSATILRLLTLDLTPRLKVLDCD